MGLVIFISLLNIDTHNTFKFVNEEAVLYETSGLRSLFVHGFVEEFLKPRGSLKFVFDGLKSFVNVLDGWIGKLRYLIESLIVFFAAVKLLLIKHRIIFYITGFLILAKGFYSFSFRSQVFQPLRL